MNININRKLGRKGFTLVELLVVITVIAILAAIAIPAASRIPKMARTIKHTANLRGIGTMMQTFKTEQGTYPTKSQSFVDSMNYDGSPTSSNDYFIQLFTENVAEAGSEESFYVDEHPICANTKKPDNVVADASGSIDQNEILEPGQVGYFYVQGITGTVPDVAPIVFDSTIDGQPGGDFSVDLRGGKALVARLNNSVIQAKIDGDNAGRITQDGGQDEPDISEIGDARIYGANSSQTLEIVSPETGG